MNFISKTYPWEMIRIFGVKRIQIDNATAVRDITELFFSIHFLPSSVIVSSFDGSSAFSLTGGMNS
jgi:hypothetical protein